MLLQFIKSCFLATSSFAIKTVKVKETSSRPIVIELQPKSKVKPEIRGTSLTIYFIKATPNVTCYVATYYPLQGWTRAKSATMLSSTFEPVDEILNCDTSEQYFPVVLFIMLYKVVLALLLSLWMKS